MMGVRSCFVVIIGLAVGLTALEQKCCEKKKVGGKSYTLVEQGGSVPDECKYSCIYSEDDNPDNLVCFVPGPLNSTCLSGKDFFFDPDKCPNYDITCSLDNALPGVPIETVETPSGCGAKCQINIGKCYAWTMIPQGPPPDAECFFLSSCKLGKSPGLVSGDRICPPNKNVLPSCPFYDVTCIDSTNVLNGNDPPIVKLPKDCGHLCQKSATCKFWTMIPRDTLPKANCTQLSKCGPSKPMDRAVSGAITCPPL